jgi:hypothetical protein
MVDESDYFEHPMPYIMFLGMDFAIPMLVVLH